jgi:hypothetical protein
MINISIYFSKIGFFAFFCGDVCTFFYQSDKDEASLLLCLTNIYFIYSTVMGGN